MIQKFRFFSEIRKFCKFQKFLKFNESVVDTDESEVRLSFLREGGARLLRLRSAQALAGMTLYFLNLGYETVEIVGF